ncbi:MAG: hypothetical protein M3347_07445, partial [Armatimonadota bacterium]|nr:hypothetical protein [Armatimonadota bacterium]
MSRVRHALQVKSTRSLFTHLQSSAFFPSVARALLAASLTPIALMLMATFMLGSPQPAQAQVTTQPVIVLDFAVAEGIDPVFGRKAADALAVELQRSGDFEVIPRQTIEQAVIATPGLRPPFNETTQRRLAEAVNARSIFSGQVLRVVLRERRSARVEIAVRQLDTSTGDYVNAARVSEVTADKL